MTAISEYPLAFVNAIFHYFDIICLITGIILLSVNVIKLDQDKNKTENTDLYKNLNISALALFGVFVINHFLIPFLNNKK
jgi:hypothetical protein